MAHALLMAAGLLLAADGAVPQLKAIELHGSPSVFVNRQGEIDACGLRVYGVEQMPDGADSIRSIDVSILLPDETVNKGFGMVKAASAEAIGSTAAAAHTTRERIFKVNDGWVRAPGFGRTLPYDGRILQSETPNAHLYLAHLDSIVGFVNTAIAGGEIQLSVKREGVSLHPIYYGRVSMRDDERQQLATCFSSLLKQQQGSVQ